MFKVLLKVCKYNQVTQDSLSLHMKVKSFYASSVYLWSSELYIAFKKLVIKNSPVHHNCHLPLSL